MSAIVNAVNGAVSAVDRHREVIKSAIDAAPENISGALTSELYSSLSFLKSSATTHGEYVQAVSDLRAANKSITRKDIDDGIKKVSTDSELDSDADEIRQGVDRWPDTVEGAELYRQLTTTLSRYCVLPKGGACAISLWIMASYSIDSFRIFAKLLVHSPQKRCGKTTLLEVMQALMPQAISGSNVTPSVIFRAIKLWGVSILLDEVDTFLHSSDDLRGIVNCGHNRSGAHVWRTEGDAVKEPKQFSTWAPMVLAMIGNPPPTIIDRSIKIGLARKTSNDYVQRIQPSFKEDCLPIRQKLTRWADDNGETLKHCEPEMPAHENDRATDNWAALFTVAELVGASNDVQEAMKLLEVSDDDVEDISIELLRDINELILSGKLTDDPTRSTQLVEYLLELTDRPWPECNRGKPLSPHKLGYILKPYKIKPNTYRFGSKTAKAFIAQDFTDAISRYLSKPVQMSNKQAETASHQPSSVTKLNSEDSNVTK